MFTVDVSDFKKLERHLKTFKRTALPYATRDAINTGVYKAQLEARAEVKGGMITRNAFTTQSIQYEKSRSLKIERQIAVVGSTQDYMADQEFGGTKHKKGKEGVWIPSAYSSGEGSIPRKKLPRKPNDIRNINLLKGHKFGKTQKQRNFVAIKMAVKTNSRFVFLEMGKKKGIFKVVGGSIRKNKKSGKYIKPKEIKIVHDMTHDSVRIPERKWLYPSVMRIKDIMPQIAVEAMWKQVKRHRLFKHLT